LEEETMWSYEHAVEAEVSAAAVWEAWADVERWGEWNADIERIAIDGPFAVDARIEMTPRGADPVVLRVAEVRPGEGFVDEAELGGVVVTTTHLVEPVGEGRVQILYRSEITGPAADEVGPELGPAITGDFPETIAALVEFAG
jgi:uncharacterized protein YndB with AHSA1/START domain